jgi:hypothetical protein
MNRYMKELLGFAVLNLIAGALFLSGIVNVEAAPGLYITFPLGIVSLGMFLIFYAVEKERVMYDVEEWVHEMDLERYNHDHSLDQGFGHAPMHA